MATVNPEELKYSIIFRVLKENKKAQEAALKLVKTDEWPIIRQLIAAVRAELLDATYETDSLDDIRKYKYLALGMESVVMLPQLAEDIKQINKEDEEKKRREEEEAKRRKYNPGAFLRKVVNRVKGGETKTNG